MIRIVLRCFFPARPEEIVQIFRIVSDLVYREERRALRLRSIVLILRVWF
jgi:hypothetical protein